MTTPNILRFTKMHGAGNDFIVLNNCADQLQLNPALIKRLADRHFGIGADQVLVVESSTQADFKYRIFNADGQEVQQCGNGARCFAQYVFDKGLTQKNQITVETLAGIIQPELIRHNWVKVNMGPAEFEPAKVPFVSEGLLSRSIGGLTQYKLPVDAGADVNELWVGVASMGNPHVVLLLEQPASDELVQRLGAVLESHPRFPERVNVGFLNVLDRARAHLRVYERGVGETLACGTGACAAAVVGMKMGLLAERVDVVKTGGTLTIEWSGQSDSDVLMTGPAQTVFEGEFYL
ncbi:diaminopimelate epimerase [Limnobacter thiooxidans]|uniref:Diaminopimelate epimerase n=1 Tax=Limnobacter thiooxidans TaxID=131080 RepID=A0AA86J5R0_9BURK|nr:diaminopimelate epimerase [Limnobacter thiooxidans]BET25295.1 diaminopimelate epimerase [Limnobacter thiooxidans]